jgi:sigma-E factor negative regulatory protein RseB
VVRERGILTCFLPGSEALLIDKRNASRPFPELHALSLDRLSQHYTFRFLGEDRVAGRKARVVAIIPRDAYRYGYRIYVDAETSLPLKSDLMDEKGNPVEQTMFTNLKVGSDIPPIDLRPISNSPSKPNLKQIWDASDSPQRWAFSRLPAGFALNYHERYSEPESGDEIDHFVVSDGLASLSVFVEKAAPDEGLRGGSRMGAVSAWGEQLDGHQVTVVGEVPVLTLREVLNGLRQAHVAGASGD